MDKALEDKDRLLQEVVNKIADDYMIASDKFEHAPALRQFLNQCRILLVVVNAQVSALMAAVLQLMWPALTAGDKLMQNSKRRQAMLQKYNTIRQDQVFINAATNLFKAISTTTQLPHMLIQKFTRVLFQTLRERYDEVPVDANIPVQDQLTKDEENVMRYVGGYIVAKLPRKVKNIPNIDNVIENMKRGSDKETFLSYTKEWMGLQNRGGLCLINDPTFLFFCELELVLRSRFPQTTIALRGLDLRVGGCSRSHAVKQESAATLGKHH